MDPIFENGHGRSRGQVWLLVCRGPTMLGPRGGVIVFFFFWIESIGALSRATDCCSRRVHGQNTGHGDGDGYFDSRPRLMFSRLQLR